MLQLHKQPATDLLSPRILLGVLGSALLGTCVQAQDSVVYRFEFVSEWSALTHPINFPPNPHYSSLVGVTHSPDISIWGPGMIASNGIEIIAETGGRAQFEADMNVLINTTDLVDRFRNTGGLTTSPAMRQSFQTINADFPVVSLLGMIAPSPDWLVGVYDINLRENGVWAREIVVDLYPYDAGTDAGISYSSANVDITPHIPIANISDIFPFIGTPRFGTYSFFLISDAACSLADLATPYEQFDFFDVSAFLSGFAAQDPIADINNDGNFDFFDVSDFLTLFTAGCP